MQDDASDPAALAFSALRGEVALLRTALEGLASASERAQAPDYSPTLGQISSRLDALDKTVGALAGSPALRLTPDSLANRLEAATAHAQREAKAQWSQAHGDLQTTVRDLDAIVARPRAALVQDRALLVVFAVGVVVGALLWMVWSRPAERFVLGFRHANAATTLH